MTTNKATTTKANAPRTLLRQPTNAKLGGVCAGFADYFDLDVNLVRATTALLVLFGPGVIAVYALLWAFMEEPKPRLVLNAVADPAGWDEAWQEFHVEETVMGEAPPELAAV